MALMQMVVEVEKKCVVMFVIVWFGMIVVVWLWSIVNRLLR